MRIRYLYRTYKARYQVNIINASEPIVKEIYLVKVHKFVDLKKKKKNYRKMMFCSDDVSNSRFLFQIEMNSNTSVSRSQLPPPSRRRPPTRIATPTSQLQSHRNTEADSNIMR